MCPIIVIIKDAGCMKMELTKNLIHDDYNAFYRLDFEDVVLHQPDAVAGSLGTCGGNGDTLMIENPTATFAGFNNLCGILSGQHSKILKIIMI